MSVSRLPAKVIKAFKSARPRLRARVASSSGRAQRNASRLPCKKRQAIVTSQADADPRAPEVDHCRQPTVPDQQVAYGTVSMDPYRRAVPGRRQRGIQTSVASSALINSPTAAIVLRVSP